MPRFFFHVQLEDLCVDEEGSELSDRDGAIKVALEIASQILRDAEHHLRRGESFRVLAEDERRAPLFLVEVRIDPVACELGKVGADPAPSACVAP